MSAYRDALCRRCPTILRVWGMWWCAAWLVLGLIPASAGAAEPWTFHVQFAKTVRAEEFTGRVYVFFTQQLPEPRMGPGWFDAEPVLARDVEELRPGEECVLAAAADGTLAFPKSLSDIGLSGYRAQAVLRLNPLDREAGTGAGNAYSAQVQLDASHHDVALLADQLVPSTSLRESQWCKLLSVHSNLLSEFHGRDVSLKAAVMLPASYYEQPDRRYPAVFVIPGFGGTLRDVQGDQPIVEDYPGGVQFLRVTLDPSCPLGHHAFADSANNGPFGRALVEELLPEFDRQYRSVAAPGARFLGGHSSGGWSSLWLQINHPDVFGGAWSTSPDPVDFRDFQQINIYREGENMFVDPAGDRRPLAHFGDQVALWFDDVSWMEEVVGYGGQLHSFEAVFSPRGADGTPRLLWDRHTGAIDAEVAQAWEQYDIRLVLERHWDTLGPKLRGKLHVFVGDQDTFYLDGATMLLKESLARLGSDAVVEIHAGRNHSTLLSRPLRERIGREMAESFLASFPEQAADSPK